MSTPVSRDPAANPRPTEPATNRALDAPSAHVPATPAPARIDDAPGELVAPGFGGIAAAIAASVGSATPAPLSEDAARLRARAIATRDGRTWAPHRDDLLHARNAHHSNTSSEMRDALAGDYDWLEGDVRLDDEGAAVMAHDSRDEGDGLTFEEWVQVAAAGGRGLKLDVKEQAAIPLLLDRLERSGIPHGRIMFNVGAVSDEQVLEIRRRFPEAWLALNPTVRDDGYHLEDLERITRLADVAGGRIAFPVRWDELTDDVIRELKPHGKVSIWAAQSEGTPDDPARERERLIERGIDGVIDLGERQSVLEEVLEDLRNAWTSEPLSGGRELVRGTRDLAIDAYEGGRELVDDGLDIVGDWLG